jgi:DNA primase
MISVEELSAIISRKVPLRKAGNRFVGRCPFHGPDSHPSFNIFQGKDGKARYNCFACGARGDAVDWLRLIEHKTYREAGGLKPDPELQRERERERAREERLKRIDRMFYDAYPDAGPEWSYIIRGLR